MKKSILTTRLALVVPLTLCAAFSSISVRAMAAETAPAAASRGEPMSTKMPEDKTPEARVKHLHDQLKITADQEAQWNNVAQVMLANASAITSAVKDREHMSNQKARHSFRAIILVDARRSAEKRRRGVWTSHPAFQAEDACLKVDQPCLSVCIPECWFGDEAGPDPIKGFGSGLDRL